MNVTGVLRQRPNSGDSKTSNPATLPKNKMENVMVKYRTGVLISVTTPGRQRGPAHSPFFEGLTMTLRSYKKGNEGVRCVVPKTGGDSGKETDAKRRQRCRQECKVQVLEYTSKRLSCFSWNLQCFPKRNQEKQCARIKIMSSKDFMARYGGACL